MGVISPARPDLAAHREATSLPFAELVRELIGVIGKKLTAYIAGVKDVRALDRWIDGTAPYKSAEERLRFAFRVVKTMPESRSRICGPGLAHGVESRTERSRSNSPDARRRPRNHRSADSWRSSRICSRRIGHSTQHRTARADLSDRPPARSVVAA